MKNKPEWPKDFCRACRSYLCCGCKNDEAACCCPKYVRYSDGTPDYGSTEEDGDWSQPETVGRPVVRYSTMEKMLKGTYER